MIKGFLKKTADFSVKILIVLTFLLAIVTLFKPELIKDLISYFEKGIQFLGLWNYLIVFLMGLIESFPLIGIVVPGQNILLLVGGFFAENSLEKLYYVIFLASIGAILSNYIGFILGKHYGDTFFDKYGLWLGVGKTEVKYLKAGVKKWGPFGIIFGKFHNFTRAFVPFIAGSMGMSNKLFWISNIIGSIIRSVTIVVIGVIFASHYETIIDYFGYIMFGIMFLFGLYVYKFKQKEFKKYMNEKNAEIEEKINKK